MSSTSSPSAPSRPVPVTWTARLENLTALDPVVRLVRPFTDALVADPARRDLLRGAWLGHALHPVLTDLPIGLFTSASVLDVVGGPEARPAARKLVGLGLLAVGPAALTGWAEWNGIGQREQRVGIVHAASNVVTVSIFLSSYRARRQGQHLRGAALSAVGTAALGVTSYLGGHLVAARKVSSRDPAFED